MAAIASTRAAATAIGSTAGRGFGDYKRSARYARTAIISWRNRADRHERCGATIDFEMNLADTLVFSSASEADALEAKRICEQVLALPGEDEDVVAANLRTNWLMSRLG